MADLRDRKLGAIIGSLVADAAAQPLHWIYDLAKLDNIIGDKEEIEFWTPSANPYYNLETGRQSCYGDQAAVVLESLSKEKGVNINHLKERMMEVFGPGTDYDSNMVQNYKYKGGVQSCYPVKGPWRHVAIKEFIKNYQSGADETGSEKNVDMDCVIKVTAVVAMFAGCDNMLDKVEDVIRLTNSCDIAVTTGLAAARLIEQYILNGDSSDAVNIVVKQLCSKNRKNPQELDRGMAGYLQEVVDKRDVPHREVAGLFRSD